MSYHTYNEYYIDMLTKNIFKSFANNPLIPINLTHTQQSNNQSNTNTPTNPTSFTLSFYNLWRSDKTFKYIQKKF